MESRTRVRRQAIGWCENLAGWFPNLRPGADAMALAEDVAAGLGPNDGHVPPAHVRAVRELVSEVEQEELVESFVCEHADQWAAVCADSGEVDALEEALIVGAARAAILERRLPPPSRLSDLETGRAPAQSSCDVLAVTLPPETVWSVVEVDAAEGALSMTRSPFALFSGAVAVASERASQVHSRRVRTLAAVLRRQLPLAEFPRASSLLGEAYGRAADDPVFADSVAEALLPLYVAQRAAQRRTAAAPR